MNYVWLAGDEKHTKDYYSDLLTLDNVKFIYKSSISSNGLISLLFRISFSNKINKYFNIPFKHIWYNYIYSKASFNNRDKTVFIFTEGWYDPKLVQWLSRRYSDVNKVLYLIDTIKFYIDSKTKMRPEHLNEEFDFVYSFNPDDVNKYGFKKTHAYLSKKDVSKLPVYQNSDCSFVGKAKDRLHTIKDIFINLKKNGCNLDFVVVQPQKNEIDNSGITYSETNISYEEYLGHEISTNCILEIVKGDSYAESLRCWEAVYYNKKLITNWPGIIQFEFYDKRFMRLINSIKDLDVEFIKKRENVSYGYSNENSPIHFLMVIKKDLEDRSKNI